MTQIIEITDIEEVFDKSNNLLYVEYLVAVFDRDFRDPPAAKVLGTERVRLSPQIGGVIRVQHVDPVTDQEIDTRISAAGSTVDAVLNQARTDTNVRISDKNTRRKWRAEHFSN